MTTIRIPTPLRPYTGGNSAVAVSGATVGEAVSYTHLDVYKRQDELVGVLAVGVGQHAAAVRLQAQDGVAVLFVVVGDALHGTGELLRAFHHRNFTPFRRPDRSRIEFLSGASHFPKCVAPFWGDSSRRCNPL